MNIGPENETVEYKKSTAELKEGVASIASILNKHGKGELYFGVKNNGDVCGMQVADTTLREISQTVGHSIEPRIYPNIEKLNDGEGHDYVRIAFEGSDAPYACKGTFRIRVSDEDVLMSAAEVRARFVESESLRNPWDRRISSKVVDDVDELALKAFVERGREKGRIAFDFINSADALERLGLMKDGMLLNAGFALFCISPVTDLKMGVFASHSRTDIIGLQHESGTLFDLVRSAEMFVISNTRSRVDTSVPGASDVYPEIPLKALHEGLMNAYAHRDWENGGAVMVEIFNDAVEIISPGWFVQGQDPEEHLSGKSVSSNTRNDLIAQTLFKSGDIESQGTGIKRIKDFCDEAGIRVEYVRVPDGTKLVFHRNDAFGQSLIINDPTDNRADVVINDGINVVINDKIKRQYDLSECESKILDFIGMNPSASAAEIAAECGISERTVQRAIRKLKDFGIVVREGSKKTGKWVVKDATKAQKG